MTVVGWMWLASFILLSGVGFQNFGDSVTVLTQASPDAIVDSIARLGGDAGGCTAPFFNLVCFGFGP